MTSEYSKEVSDALELLHQLDPLYANEKYNEFIDKLNEMRQEFRELGMEQNILNRRGKAYYALDKNQEAVEDLTKAIKLGGEGGEDSKDLFTLDCLHYLGWTYFELYQWELALDAWERIERIHSEVEITDDNFGPFDLMFHKGVTLFELDKLEPAIELLEEVLRQFQPSETEVLSIWDISYYLVKALKKNEKYQEALAILAGIDESTLDGDLLVEYLQQKCMVLERLNHIDDLIQAAEQLASSGRKIDQAIALYWSGIAYHRLGAMDESISRLNRAVQLSEVKDWVHEYARHALVAIAKKKE